MRRLAGVLLCSWICTSCAKPQWMDSLADLYRNSLGSPSACERREYKKSWSMFEERIERLLPGENGLVRLGADIRSGALSLPDSPHVYALIGGGEWGPRVAAQALLEAVYVKAWNHVTVVDLAAAAQVRETQGLEAGVVWLKEKVASAIRMCPGKAAVVFDNAHVLKGEDILLLDPLLLLFDDKWSHMEDGNGSKVSGEGSLFLLLVNEVASEEHSGLDGKSRLQNAWEYEGPEFTTNAFVGRVDGAFLLSSAAQPPSPDAELRTLWQNAALKTTVTQESGSCVAGLSDRSVTALKVAGALCVAGIAAYKIWEYPGSRKDSQSDTNARTYQVEVDHRGGKPNGGGDHDDGWGGSARNRPLQVHGGGSGAVSNENEVVDVGVSEHTEERGGDEVHPFISGTGTNGGHAERGAPVDSGGIVKRASGRRASTEGEITGNGKSQGKKGSRKRKTNAEINLTPSRATRSSTGSLPPAKAFD